MKRAAEVTENPTTSTKKAKLDNVSSVIPSSQSPTRQSSSTSSSSSSSSTVSSTLPKNVTLPMNSVIEVQWYVSKTCLNLFNTHCSQIFLACVQKSSLLTLFVFFFFFSHSRFVLVLFCLLFCTY